MTPLSQLLQNLGTKDQFLLSDSLNEIERRYIVKAARRHAALGGDYEDGLQIARIAIYKSARNYDPTHPAENYVSVVLRNCLVSNRLAARIPTRKPPKPILSLYAHVGNPDHDDLNLAAIIPAKARRTNDVELQDLADQLWRLLPSYLTEAELTALRGRMQGYDYAEIGNRKSVDNALQRAMGKLHSLAVGEKTNQRLRNLISGIRAHRPYSREELQLVQAN
jgi:DNA-directed RNA polymerase specialized sigma24 family protein